MFFTFKEIKYFYIGYNYNINYFLFKDSNSELKLVKYIKNNFIF